MINLDHLRYFLDSATLGSIAAAARRHRVSPSAVSQAIRSLERHFDCELTTHMRELALTTQGKALVDSAPALFAAAGAVEDQMAEARDAFAGEVVLGTQQSIAHAFLPEFLTELRRRYPKLRPRIRLATTDVVLEQLTNGDIELALSVDNVAFDAFKAVTIREGQFIQVASDSNADSGAGPFILTEEARETLIFRREFEKCHGHPPDVIMQINSWGIVRRLAESGLGVGFVPDYIVRPQHNVHRLECQLPPIKYRIAAYYPSRPKPSHLAKAFIDALEEFGRTTAASYKPKR